MVNLKQLTIKIDTATLDNINRHVAKAHYWKRNAVINGVLTAIFDICSDTEISSLYHYWRHNPSSKPSITIRK